MAKKVTEVLQSNQSAGYSGTPLAKKLGIKPGMKLVFVNEPAYFRNLLEAVPDVSISTKLSEKNDFVLFFSKSRSELNIEFTKLTKSIHAEGILWMAWPKKTSGLQSDLTENVLREIFLPVGLVDVKVCAIDETWSGLKFVWRVEKRSGVKAR